MPFLVVDGVLVVDDWRCRRGVALASLLSEIMMWTRFWLDYTEDFVIIVHDQTSGDQTVFTGLAGVRDGFTGLFRLRPQQPKHFAAFGGQDVDRVWLDHTEDSVFIVYD